MRPRILLDVEGTTTSISFVVDVLFPYARARMADYVRDTWTDPETRASVAGLVDQLAADTAAGLSPPHSVGRAEEMGCAAAVSYLLWLMDRDAKVGPLKELQGRIWRSGYESGSILGHVFDDVPVALRAWSSVGQRVCIYSSGSVEAQRLLFSNSVHGDLTPWIAGHFDTAVGMKRSPESYLAIAASEGATADEFVFASDSVEELDAAAAAGMRVALAVRPGNPTPKTHEYPTFERLSDLDRF